MSPLDDELRTVLQRRATTVAPSPDPLAGIERRAGRMRRNRLAASLAGSVLAVAAVATVVPLLTGPTAVDGPPVAVTGPTAAPTPGPTASPTVSPSPGGPRTSDALDPASPWGYRGTALAELGQGLVDTVTREYATRFHGAAVELTPLWGQVLEPSGQSELVFVALVDGMPRWGVAQATESGPEFPVDEPLPRPALALAAALPGDEAPRLVVVASPAIATIEYGPDDASEYAAMAVLADGVATTPLEGDPATDSFRLLDRAGSEVFRARAPDLAGSPPKGELPANVLQDWPERGEASDDLRSAAERAFAHALDRAGEPVESHLLFGSGDDAGNVYVLLQAWFPGDDAYTFGYTVRPDGEAVPFLGPKTEPQAPVLALLVPAAPGQAFDTLAVVPRPGTGQVLYREAGGEYRPVGEDPGADGLSFGRAVDDGVVIVDRRPGATGDRLRLLDGDGDLDAPFFDGAVEDLLCGLRGCG